MAVKCPDDLAKVVWQRDWNGSFWQCIKCLRRFSKEQKKQMEEASMKKYWETKGV